MIRNLLALIGLLFVLFVTAGWFMKWYTYTREDGKLTLLIFTDKVEEGIQNLKDNTVKALTKPEEDKSKADHSSNPNDQKMGPPAPASLPLPSGNR